MVVCIKCGTLLVQENWYVSAMRIHHHLCKECSKQKARKQRKTHRTEILQQKKQYYQKNRSLILGQRHSEWVTFKEIVVAHYSNNTMACANPYNQHKEPYTDMRALSIDHINGGGGKQRKELFANRKLAGTHFYKWLIRNNYPIGFQVLCMNCQFVKRYENNELVRK